MNTVLKLCHNVTAIALTEFLLFFFFARHIRRSTWFAALISISLHARVIDSYRIGILAISRDINQDV